MNFTEEARSVYMNHCLHGSTEPEFIQSIAAALQSAYERGRQEAQPQNVNKRLREKCAICEREHDNNVLTDICKACEARINEDGSP